MDGGKREFIFCHKKSISTTHTHTDRVPRLHSKLSSLQSFWRLIVYPAQWMRLGCLPGWDGSPGHSTHTHSHTRPSYPIQFTYWCDFRRNQRTQMNPRTNPGTTGKHARQLQTDSNPSSGPGLSMMYISGP